MYADLPNDLQTRTGLREPWKTQSKSGLTTIGAWSVGAGGPRDLGHWPPPAIGKPVVAHGSSAIWLPGSSVRAHAPRALDVPYHPLSIDHERNQSEVRYLSPRSPQAGPSPDSLWTPRPGNTGQLGRFGCQSFFSSWASITRIPLGPRRYVSL